MQATLRQTAPRLAYLIPDFHNPTGALIDESDAAQTCCGSPAAPARP